MTPTRQTKFGIGGDCFLAALASVLDLPLATIPPFNEMMVAGERWATAAFEFVEKLGGGCAFLEPTAWIGREVETVAEKRAYWSTEIDVAPLRGLDLFWLASGPSPRLAGEGHTVVYVGDRLAFDPHPSDAGIEHVTSGWFADRRRSTPWLLGRLAGALP